MFKPLLVASLALTFVASTAHATTIDITLGKHSGSNYTYTSGGTLNPDIDLATTKDLKLHNGTGLLPAGKSFTNFAKSPTGSLYDNDYLYVSGGSKAALKLGKTSDVFSFTWGSIDDYNTLTLTDSRGVTYTITGAEILDQLSHPDPGTSQANVVITDPFGDIVKAVLTSCQNSFEAGNFGNALAAVPLPASSVLFALALAGLLFVGRRKQKA